ncbi:MAG: ABC transporter ATP-binding protein [Betaproteobacteria bacterium]|nr:ABC transporter ATP-binding protein [Betaproteobacteria bacterium]
MFIEIAEVSKQFLQRGGATPDKPFAALQSISVVVEQGKMLALVGPSGSGKTTLLRCIAGLETPDQGDIRIDGREVFSTRTGANTPTEKRNLGLIFQSYALWPNMTAEHNVAYPLRRRNVPDAECRARVARHLELVGCGHLGDRYPHELSGGQQQRIALARALVYEPAVVLLDEPLSNLDTSLREHLRAQIREIQRRVGFTGVYVTHDQGEAFYVGDRVAILGEGRLVQFGTPDEIYRNPNRAGVAAFVGASNRVEGRLGAGGGTFECQELGVLPLAAPVPGAATVMDRVLVGACDEYTLELRGGVRWRARSDLRLTRYNPGESVALAIAPDEFLVYPGRA